jgi:hypothetical protein
VTIQQEPANLKGYGLPGRHILAKGGRAQTLPPVMLRALRRQIAETGRPRN